MAMFTLTLIGIGTGNPDHLTAQGAAAIRAADVILLPEKGADKADLAQIRRDICARVLGEASARIVAFDLPVRDESGDYRNGVEDWHDRIARAWTQALAPCLPVEKVALLVWGDPSLYDSSLRIARRLDPAPDIRVIPGVTALQALTAAHAIALNEIGAPVLITTGRQLRANGWPRDAERVAVMLDAGGAYETLEPGGLWIWWGAYLGMANEITVSGWLEDVAGEIAQARAQARATHGWIMDVYLLERRADGAVS